MKRNLIDLSQKEYDILVIGGGIYGASVARDAAMRGLSVALIERADFGQGASNNNLKIIHGGLRYLQDGNLPLVRQMSRERRAWMRIAPHLTRPLPCLMPTGWNFKRNPLIMKAAMALNDLAGFDRNKGTSFTQYLPKSHHISMQRCREILPGLRNTAVTGAAVWHDGQVLNSERLLLAVLQTAAANGAQIANYVEAVDFLKDGRQIKGIQSVDKLTGMGLAIRAKLIVNCTGARIDALLSSLNGHAPKQLFPLSIAVNIITRQIFPDHAVALPGRESQIRFIVPWQEYSIIGTEHQPLNHGDSTYEMRQKAVQTLLDEVNFAYPDANLTREDVIQVHFGFLPTVGDHNETGRVRLLRESQIYDHEKADGLIGLISVVGVKYTTARHTAEKAVDLICQKLQRPIKPSLTGEKPVYGGEMTDLTHFLAQAQAERPRWLSEESLKHLVQTYGARYQDILAYREENPVWGRTVSSKTQVLLAEIIHAVRVEMAETLSDVIQRRTNLGEVGLPDAAIVLRCADLMMAELKWTPQKRFQEIQDLYDAYGEPLPEEIQPAQFETENGKVRFQKLFLSKPALLTP